MCDSNKTKIEKDILFVPSRIFSYFPVDSYFDWGEREFPHSYVQLFLMACCAELRCTRIVPRTAMHTQNTQKKGNSLSKQRHFELVSNLIARHRYQLGDVHRRGCSCWVVTDSHHHRHHSSFKWQIHRKVRSLMLYNRNSVQVTRKSGQIICMNVMKPKIRNTK